MKTRKRTPRKVLSLLLCVLMVATSVVFANPFTATAADISDRVVFDESRYRNYASASGSLSVSYASPLGKGSLEISGITAPYLTAVPDSTNPTLTSLNNYNNPSSDNYLNFDLSPVSYYDGSYKAVIRKPVMYAFYDNAFPPFLNKNVTIFSVMKVTEGPADAWYPLGKEWSRNSSSDIPGNSTSTICRPSTGDVKGYNG